ncbi:MAG TPA: IS4 family transposase [Pyrinomonadaceae bacterium]
MINHDFDNVEQWAERQWGSAKLGDQRRTRRAVRVGAALAAQPSASLPQQSSSWHELKAAYRLLNAPDATHQALSQPHWDATHRAARTSPGTLLFIQDTSELDFTAHPHTKGLGLIGNTGGRGFLMHSCLAVRADGNQTELVGLAAQEVWTRHEVKKGRETRHQRRQRRTESDVWAEVIEKLGAAPDGESGTRWVSVGDRASDVFSYLRRARALGWHCLVRVCQERVIETPQGQRAHLLSWAREALVPRAQQRIWLRARAGVPKRQLQLQIGWSEVRICAPQLGPERGQEPVRGWCIRCWEGCGQAEQIEWILFSTVEVQEAAQAREQVQWYASRWVIEEYHKCLKTGCRMEARQLESAAGLKALLGFLSIVAFRLLKLREYARTQAERPAEEVVAEELVEVVRARLEIVRGEPLTVRQFWHGVARLGGFIGRKSDGEPGWQTLWRGWLRLQDLCWGALHAQK